MSLVSLKMGATTTLTSEQIIEGKNAKKSAALSGIQKFPGSLRTEKLYRATKLHLRFFTLDNF